MGRIARAVVLVVLVVGGCRSAEELRSRSPVPVRVRVVAEAAGRGATRYSGSIEPASKVDLAFKVSGYVRELAQVSGPGGSRKIQEGDWVKKGTVMAVVTESDYQQRISAARADLAQATASQKQTQLDFGRATTLLRQSAIPQAEFDTAGANRDMANAKAQSARARVGEAELAYADCTLRAPFDGVVIRRNVEVGTLASAGLLAFTLADTRQMKVIFGAPDTLLDRLRLGDKLTVRLETLARDLTAEITRIAPSADVRSRAFDVEATLANPDDQIKTGMIAALKIPEAAKAGSTLGLPLTAVVRAPRDPRGFAVFVVETSGKADVARLREVKLGDVIGNSVLVTSGLKPGERVIDRGATLVNDGETVRVVR